jgi:CRISPR-associated endonuclease/helicase Cas3
MTNLDFSAFFEAVHGVPPLPWQNTLATRLLTQHSWPDLIDLPTASGKTACIDIAVFHLAACVEQGEPWRAARRVVFVVDRRIIVDAAFERAKKLSVALKESKDPVVAVVSTALSKLGGELPLCCQKLRGGMPRERGFALDPAQPMIITSTIDQVGSRLLFRGYGLSSYSQPLHAGLLSHDTLILLDEAHLGTPFMETVRAIRREQARAKKPLKSVQPVRLVSLSATATSDGERFQLSKADLHNKFINARRTASKPARLVEAFTKPTEHIKLLLEEALNLYKSIEDIAPAVAIIVNRVKTARELFDELCAKSPKDINIELMIGRSRPLDREEITKRLLCRVAAGRTPSPGERGFIVVATQAIEVGADLDFQGLVTECASLDALRQRFGRLDRLGTFRKSRAVIVGGSNSDDDPIYGAALKKTWQWLQNIAVTKDRALTVDFSIEAMDAVTKNTDVRQLCGVPREQLCLTPSHVQLLCQTAPTPMYDPDVGALLHGLKTEQPDVQVVWRANIPIVREQEWCTILPNDVKAVNTLLALIPPTNLETLALPLFSVRAWLAEQAASHELGDLEGVSAKDEEIKPARKVSSRDVWRRAGDGWEVSSGANLRPGDTIVVPSAYGGCDQFGFAPTSQAPVEDLSERACEALERERIVIVTEEYLRQRVAPDRPEDIRTAWGAVQEAYESLQYEPRELLSILLERLSVHSAMELVSIDEPFVEPLPLLKQPLYALILRTGKAGTEDISDEDLSSSFTVCVLLDEHNRAVGSRARNLARSVGLESDLVESMGCAGDLHDLGKADPRFQRLLRAGDNVTSFGELLAKGLRRKHYQHVELGERHEAYSVAMLRCFPKLLIPAPDAELALYLVGTHHGRGRAMMPFKDDDGTRFRVKVANGETLEYEGIPLLGELGSKWPVLFWKLVKRYGPWGLAYLESVLRLADHLQSRDEIKNRS